VADDGTTRGQFLSLSTVGIGAVIGGVIGVPATAYMLAPVTDEAKFEPVFLGTVDQFPADPSFKPTAATYVEDSQNPATSPGLAFVQNTGKSNTDWLAADAMFVVFSNRCMHLGCPVAVAQGVGFACPCHGGQYDKEGRRTAGPPIRPLDRFQWEVKNSDELWITQRWSVEFIDGHLQYFPVKMPGQPVTPPGPSLVADVLYPNVTYDHGPVPKPK
jgi:quinol---cytochrome c reductase iron-sulfur subunit, bacillus type